MVAARTEVDPGWVQKDDEGVERSNARRISDSRAMEECRQDGLETGGVGVGVAGVNVGVAWSRGLKVM